MGIRQQRIEDLPILDYFLLSMAQIAADYSGCERKHVGASLDFNTTETFWGYNGTGCPHGDACVHKGLPDGCDKPCNGTHAEVNALAMARESRPDGTGGTIAITHFPCSECARALVSAGLEKVVFINDYGDNKSLPILLEAGIDVVKVTFEED